MPNAALRTTAFFHWETRPVDERPNSANFVNSGASSNTRGGAARAVPLITVERLRGP